MRCVCDPAILVICSVDVSLGALDCERQAGLLGKKQSTSIDIARACAFSTRMPWRP